MQYGHIYAAFYIIIKLKVMFWKLYIRIYIYMWEPLNVMTYIFNIYLIMHMQPLI